MTIHRCSCRNDQATVLQVPARELRPGDIWLTPRGHIYTPPVAEITHDQENSSVTVRFRGDGPENALLLVPPAMILIEREETK